MSGVNGKMIRPETIRKIALVNFGGIGDEILFSPVIAEVRRYFPKAHLTLILEDRSGSVKSLLPDVDAQVEMNIQGASRIQIFGQLTSLLRGKCFDLVISSGSSPYIPVMLYLSGIPNRVGFQTGWTSRNLLTIEAPLNRKAYASEMYFSLARQLLLRLEGNDYRDPDLIQPVLKQVSEDDRAWARELLNQALQPPGNGGKTVLIHPGVSKVSVEKNMLKGWSVEKWRLLIQLLAEKHRVFLVGGPDDEAVVDAIVRKLPIDMGNFENLYGQTRNLKQLAALVEQVDALVSVDSSPMHLAVGLNKPVVVMFGPTDEKKLLPVQPHFRAVKRDKLYCRPCLWDVRATSCENPVCLDVEVDAMAREIEEVLTLNVSQAVS